MNFQVHFCIHENIDNLYDALLPEFKDNKYNRSKVSFKKKKDKLDILIEAKDITALKANLNSVINLIEVFNKIGDE
jgi:tRNA threonylcarbamoyladenosine modification (KEOPS) complex  Pcc1 subunit